VVPSRPSLLSPSSVRSPRHSGGAFRASSVDFACVAVSRPSATALTVRRLGRLRHGVQTPQPPPEDGPNLRRVQAEFLDRCFERLDGEWWRYGEHRYGGREYQAAPLGYKADTLTRAARVCERIPPEERDERLSFAYYVALARLESQPRGRIRDQAIANDWTVRDTERAVTRAKGGVRDDAVLHEPVTRCSCGRSWPCPGAPGAEREQTEEGGSLTIGTRTDMHLRSKPC
jgi:hypothetical protein